jgi:hypothetical protein
MYRKRDKEQMTIYDFILPFGGKLQAENRWVKMAQIMPWDMIEDLYAASFKDERSDGRPPIPARVAFGALYIQENENFPDERTLEHIAENAYMQYFLGLTEFNPRPLFDATMMTWFRKRFSPEDIAKINEELYRRLHPPQDEPPRDKECGNKGTLVLDATVAPSDIRYPTDLSLLNECREKTEAMIERGWEHSRRSGHKTSYNRKTARKSYLALQKQRKPRKKAIRRATRQQLGYVEKNLETLDKLLSETGEGALRGQDITQLKTIREVLRQQKEHAANPKKSISDRIVSLRQPHVRPIVRGKAGAMVEFGQKIAFSVVDGFTFIEEQSWNNFAEGATLQASAEKYRRRHGVYPEAILADKTYRNRNNLAFCKALGIRLSGPRLGRPKMVEQESERKQAYRDSCDRNIVESRNGIVKRRYGFSRIMAWLSQTAQTEAAMNVLVMNVALLLRILLRFFKIRFGFLFWSLQFVCSC